MPRAKIAYQYGVSDVAELCGVSNSAIFHLMKQGKLDLGDLMSVLRHLAASGRDDVRHDLIAAFGRIGNCGPIPKSERKESEKKAASELEPRRIKHTVAKVSG